MNLMFRFFLLILILTSLLIEGETKKMEENKISLPKNISAWTRPDLPRLITSKNIFDYMDGAGELYLGYHFNRLEVYEYKSKDENDIL